MATGTLQGTVRDGGTNNPIAGAAVTAGPSSRLTDASGNYSFAPIAAGSYTVTAAATGYANASANAIVSANGTTTQDFTLLSTTTMHSLSVSKTGTGTGTVTSSPAGISCGATCSANFPEGTAVTLTATPSSNSVFSSWSGDCSGTSSTCNVTMSANRSVTASFNDKPAVSITSPTAGSFVKGNSVTVAASASDGNGVSQVEFFLDGTGNANMIGQDDSAPYQISWDTTGVSDGGHSLIARATDTLGATNTSAAVAVTVDNAAPTFTITAPTSLTASVTLTFSEIVHGLTSSNVTFRERDSGTAVANTMSCFNASAVAVTCSTGDVVTAKLKQSAALIPGQYYRVMVNPTGASSLVVDRAGNPVATNSYRDFRASTFQQQNSSRAVYRWRNVSNTNAYGGSYTTEHLSGASASFGFSGTSITWYTITGPSQGLAYVYIDGVNVGSFNQYASSTHYKVARSFTGLSSGSHTIKIVLRGLKGSTAGTGTYVVVDAFLAGGTLYSSPTVTYTWHTTSASSASGGSYVTTNLGNSYVTFTFRGTGIDWYTVKGPNQGKANVYIDGALQATIDNYASSTAYKIGWSIRGLADAVHTLKVTVLGQHRSASTGSSIGIDAWGIV